ncbi:phytoene desaturase family protein [Limnohabitans sp.]|uniref:phytoene desaturase family protein n=1 Tax=Limnohabitans sp. TaxID=1907725 RepID=UPI00333E9926
MPTNASLSVQQIQPADAKAPFALVIGSGFGGLAAAVRMCAKGWRVQVLEKLNEPGGRARVIHVDGHTFDTGPTIVTAPLLLEELWGLAGRQLADDVALRLLDPFYRIRFDDGDHFDYSGDPERMRAEVLRIDPTAGPGYAAFLAEADLCLDLCFDTLSCQSFDNMGDLFKAVPAIVRMKGWRSLHAMVATHIQHPKLRQVLSLQSLLIGGNPFSVTCVYSLINALERRFGVHWTMGGTGVLVNGLVSVIEGMGGSLRTGAEVRRIEVADGRACGVTLASGETIAADLVVCNADAAWTYKNLIDEKHRKVWTNAKVEKGKYSMSLFVWYFGTNKRFDDVPHHMMLLGPRYEAMLQDIFKHHHLSNDFSLYLHRPTATDPAMAPQGCDTFYVLAPVPNLQSGTDWAIHAEPYRAAVAQALEETVLPNLSAHLTVSFMTTPQDFQDNLLSYQGAAFALEPLMMQSAWFRPHNRSEDIQNLFMVGASTHPGAGIPGVLMSAKALDTVLPDAATFKRSL